jgi:phospholipid-transporting ATPase
VILPLAAAGTESDALWRELGEFARKGLRTLVLGERVIERKDYETWAEGWKRVTLLSGDDKQDRMDEQAKLIERDFSILGVTAIEDKLQAGVPEAIHTLLSANIRIWVLTGDKQETAIEVAKACSLLSQSPSDSLVILSSKSPEAALEDLSKAHNTYFPTAATTLESAKATLDGKEQTLSIVIDGVTLEWVLCSSKQVRRQLYELGFLSQACVCCRVSPAQKMQVVQLVKEMGEWITLAIGDGANDVSMIQEAHIGIGISGKEGTQAVQAADYSLAQFSYLQKLLLVHGRWGYRRISLFICYYFYKNMVIVFAEICFAFFNGYSGQLYWADWIPALYNTFWTSWPCLLTFCYEQDLTAENSLRNPGAYRAGQLCRYFTFKRFWLWVLCSIYHGLFCFWLPMVGIGDLGNEEGKAAGLFWTSTLSFTILIHIVSLKLMLESGYWTGVNLFGVGISVIVYYSTIIIMSLDPVSKTFQPNMNNVFLNLLNTPKAWILILFTPLLALLPDFCMKTWRKAYSPDPLDILVQAQRSGKLPESAHFEPPSR